MIAPTVCIVPVRDTSARFVKGRLFGTRLSLNLRPSWELRHTF